MPDTSDKVCPQCGTNNPITNKFCGECGGRLPESVAIPSSTEQPPATETPVADAGTLNTSSVLPAWLQEVEQQAPSPLTSSAPRVDADAATPSNMLAQDDLPAWLRESLSTESPERSTASGDNASLPSWLTDLHTDEETPDATQPSQQPSSGLPAWLATPADEESMPETTPAQPPAELPAWLADIQTDTGPEATTSQPSAELPAWLRELSEPPAPTAGTRSEEPSQPPVELPAWLRNDEADDTEQDAGPAPQAPAETRQALPAWLAELTQDTEQPETTNPAAPIAPTLPSWLTAADPSEGVSPTPSRSADLQAQEENVQQSSVPVPQTPGDDATAQQSPSRLDQSTEQPIPSGTSVSADEQASTAGQAAVNPLPAWLQELADEASSSPAAARNEADDGSGLPAWLQDNQPSAPPPTRDSLPNWLSESAPNDNDSTRSVPQTTAFPSWLQADAPPESQAGSAATPVNPGQNPPEAGAAQSTSASPSATPPSPNVAPSTGDSQTPPQTGNLPDWLRNLGDDEQDSSGQTPPATAPGTNPASTAVDDIPGLPGWLREANQAAPSPQPATQPNPDATNQLEVTTPSPALPAWLSDIDPIAAPEAETLPAWLQGADDEIRATTTSPPAATPVDAAAPLPATQNADLPPWLQDTDQDGTTPLPGSAPDSLGDEGAFAADRIDTQPAVITTTEQAASAHLLERLLEETAPEPVVQPQAAPPRRRWLIVLLQFVLFLLLAGVILAILWNSRLNLSLGATSPSDTPTGANGRAATAVIQAIEGLDSGRPILISYEWDGTRTAELGQIEDVVMHTVTSRQLPIITMSTDPQGTVLSEQRVRQLLQLPGAYAAGATPNWANIGYFPGGELPLARMRTGLAGLIHANWNGRPLAQEPQPIQALCQQAGTSTPTCSLQRLGMILVIADQSSDIQRWTEQIASANPDIPIVYLLPAELGPQVQPYLTRANMHAISGLEGALALLHAQGQTSEWIGRQIDAIDIGQAIFGVLLLLGIVPAIIIGWRKRRPGNGDVWER